MDRLAKGMTVQSDNGNHYAFCVRCQWESPKMRFPLARKVATRPCPNCCQQRKANTVRSVLQDWVMELPLRHQGVLCSAIRGCDTATKPGGVERHLSAYLRWTFLNPADPREIEVPGAFMRSDAPDQSAWKASELGHFPQHFYAHLMHAFQVVAVHHPDHQVAYECRVVYQKMTWNLHLETESDEHMDKRLTEDRFLAGTVVS